MTHLHSKHNTRALLITATVFTVVAVVMCATQSIHQCSSAQSRIDYKWSWSHQIPSSAYSSGLVLPPAIYGDDGDGMDYSYDVVYTTLSSSIVSIGVNDKSGDTAQKWQQFIPKSSFHASPLDFEVDGHQYILLSSSNGEIYVINRSDGEGGGMIMPPPGDVQYSLSLDPLPMSVQAQTEEQNAEMIDVDPHILSTPVISDLYGNNSVIAVIPTSFHFSEATRLDPTKRSKVLKGRKLDINLDSSEYQSCALVLIDLREVVAGKSGREGEGVRQHMLLLDKSKYLYSRPAVVASMSHDGDEHMYNVEIVIGTTLGSVYVFTISWDEGWTLKYKPIDLHAEIQAEITVITGSSGDSRMLCTTGDGRIVSIRLLDGSVQWSAQFPDHSFTSQPAIAIVSKEGSVVAVSETGYITLLDLLSGEHAVGFPVSIGAKVYSGVVEWREYVVVTSYDGQLFFIDVRENAGNERCYERIVYGENTYATPYMSKGGSFIVNTMEGMVHGFSVSVNAGVGVKVKGLESELGLAHDWMGMSVGWDSLRQHDGRALVLDASRSSASVSVGVGVVDPYYSDSASASEGRVYRVHIYMEGEGEGEDMEHSFEYHKPGHYHESLPLPLPLSATDGDGRTHLIIKGYMYISHSPPPIHTYTYRDFTILSLRESNGTDNGIVYSAYSVLSMLPYFIVSMLFFIM